MAPSLAEVDQRKGGSMSSEISESSVNVNENTSDTPASDTLSVASGEIVTFDDLEQIQQHHKESKTKTPPAKKEPLPKKASSDEDGQGKGEASEKSGAAQDDDKTKELKAKEESAAQKKLVKAKLGDAELDLDLETKVPLKVNGKDEEVTLDELRNNYAGKKAWSEEFSKLGTEKQKFKQERDTVNQQLTQIFEASKVDGMQALMKMAEFSGLDPVQWRKDFFEKLMPQLESYQNMSEDERTAAELAWERDHFKQQAESQSKRTADEEAFKAFETKVRGLQQTHQVSETEFEKTFAELAQLQRSGEFKGEITPEKIVEVVKTERIWNQLDSTFAELKLSFTDAEKIPIYRDMTKLAFDNNLSVADVKEIATEAWGKKKSQNISRKLQTNGQAEKIAGKKKDPINPAQEPWSFDDL
jgi:hypothetical protein